ncbi:MAG: magnesium transporter MgtE N-terminal domain-containing protein [Gammaproteobacteria bacterium]
MLSELSRHYLETHPQEAADVVEAAAPAALKSLLDDMPDELRARLLPHLLSETAGDYLASIAPEAAAAQIARVAADVAARILGTMRAAERRPIIDALPSQRRESVRQVMRYPQSSVGALMQTRALVCRSGTSVRQARRIVQRFADTALSLMLVLDDDMRPVGQLPLSTLMSLPTRAVVDEHMQNCPRPFRVHDDVRAVVRDRAWHRHDYVAVVHPNGAFAGLLPKARLHDHALAEPSTAPDEQSIGTTVLSLAELALLPAIDLLVRATTDGAQPTENADEHR